MKHKKVPEPHCSLLFRLVEIYRAQPEATSGVILLIVRGTDGVLQYRPDPKDLDRWEPLPPYTRENLDYLQNLDHITYTFQDPHSCRYALKQEALDYYDYMHSPAWRRWLSDVWDKTEKHWLTLLVGWLGGWCAWLSSKVIPRLIEWIANLFR